jgi:integrase
MDPRPIDWVMAFSLPVSSPALHDARHTAGTLLGELLVDIHVIQRILGHAQVTTTRIYTDPTDPLTREATGRMGGLLWPESEAGEQTRDEQ